MNSQWPDRILKTAISFAAMGLLGIGTACTHEPPPPTQSAVPSSPAAASPGYPADFAKPMPDQSASNLPAPAFDDPPLVDQKLPEEQWFVTAYNQVNRPRVAVFVNRTLDGVLVEPGTVPVQRTETVQKSTGAVDVNHSEGSSYADWEHAQAQGQQSQFKSQGPAEYKESTTTYLHQGQYDDALLQSLDYAEIESLLTDWMSASGKVTILSPSMIRSHLNQDQVKDLQDGKAAGLNDLGQTLQADVLVQVTAHPVRRSGAVVVLLVAEAVNIRGGESIAQASVEMPTPVDRSKLNNYTRFMVRKVMHGMIGSWSGAPLPAAPAAPANPLTPPPALPATVPSNLP